MLEWPLASLLRGSELGKRSREDGECDVPPTSFPSSAKCPGHSHRVDSLMALAGARLASKSSDGRVIVWSLADGARSQLAAWRAPAADKGNSHIGSTADGAVLVVGSNSGDVLAYDSADGTLLTRLSATKFRTPVLSCAVAQDCRTVVATYSGGIIGRWEVVRQEDHSAAAEVS